MMRSRREVALALRRRAGASPETVEMMKRATEGYNDWRGTCQLCGFMRRGHVSEMLKPCPGCGVARHD